MPGGATSIANGKQKFIEVGCALCHTPSFTTSTSTIAALSEKPGRAQFSCARFSPFYSSTRAEIRRGFFRPAANEC
jgi:hypothetical protein